jgi:DNA-binding protein H-NS
MSTSQPIRFTETSSIRAPSNGTSPAATDETPMAKRSPDPDIDLQSLSDDELASLAVEVPREIERRQAQREAELLAFIREQMTVLCIPPQRLKAALLGKAAKTHVTAKPDGRSVVAPKYRNPATGETWTGRGEAPSWIEFSGETLPPRKPGGQPRKVPLAKFRIPEPDGEGKE